MPRFVIALRIAIAASIVGWYPLREFVLAPSVGGFRALEATLTFLLLCGAALLVDYLLFRRLAPPPSPPEMSHRYPEAFQFLASHLYQSWSSEYDSIEEAVATGLRDSSEERKRGAASDIEGMLRDFQSDQDLWRALHELGVGIDATLLGEQVRPWLEGLVVRLRSSS